MADLVDVMLEDARWQTVDIADISKAACGAALRHLRLEPERFEIALLACNDQRICVLNGNFRGKATATNVLSWPAVDLAAEAPGKVPFAPDSGRGDMPTPLGDIAISYDTCMREAQAQAIPLSAHASHLLVHGCLHLLGYDHVCDRDAALMERLEVEILANLGIGTPY